MFADRVIDIKESAKFFDPASFEFPELLFTTLGSDGRLPYWVKCICFGVLLYSAGIAATFASNTLFPWAGTTVETPYLVDYSFMVVCAVLGCGLAFLMSTLRKLDHSLIQVSKRVGYKPNFTDERKFMEFILWVRDWMPRGERVFERPAFWYYLETFGGAILGVLVGIYWIFYTPVVFWGSEQYSLSSLYFIYFCAILAYVVGAIIFVTMGAVYAVHRYCRDFITQERVLALNPDRVGGLRPIGRFSLGLDISFALPSCVVFRYLAQGVSITDPMIVVTLLLYTIVLVVIFFIPLSAAHDVMLQAKEKAYDQVNEMSIEIISKISTKSKGSNFSQIKALKDVYFLYDKVSKMAVWPLNLSIVLKFVATSSFPIIGSLIVAYASQFIGI